MRRSYVLPERIFIVYFVGIDKRRCYLVVISGRRKIYVFVFLVRGTPKENAMSAAKHSATIPFGPSAPELTAKNLWDQFWADVYGKEVQTTATYSYTWVADQFGHICLGLIGNFAATALCGVAMTLLGWSPEFHYDTGKWPGLIIVAVGAAVWEWFAYSKSADEATKLFPLDKALLLANAQVAAAYMILGGVLGFAFHLHLTWALVVSAGVLVVAVRLAPWWLRQKIIWQKAALPYLFRLADVLPTVDKPEADTLHNLIQRGAPPDIAPCQIVIGGPIGAGRTSMAAGIGTEFAFKNHKVRYLSLDSLLEFAVNSTATSFRDDCGPTTITYWRWSELQVVIIDGIGPMLAVDDPGRQPNFSRFKAMLDTNLSKVAQVLKQCHTVWVVGDLCPPPPSDQLGKILEEFAKAVAAYCQSNSKPFVIQLDEAPEPPTSKGPIFPSTRAAPRVAKLRSIYQVSTGTTAKPPDKR